MEARLQRRIQRYGWDAAAGVYGSAWMDQLRPAHDLLLEKAALQPGERVLEVACGTGLVTKRAADAIGPEGLVYATDISSEMVKKTIEASQACGFFNVEVARADGENLDVKDNSFDVAICALGLMYVAEPINALAEMSRAVKSGGRIVVTVWGERKNCAWADIFPIVDSEVNSEVCPLFFSLGTTGTLESAMLSARLDQTEQTRQKTTLRFRNDQELLEAIIDGGAVAIAAKRFNEEARGRVNQRYLGSVEQYQMRDGSYEIPGEFVTAVGLVA